MKCTMKWTKNWLCLAASLLAMGTFALAAGPDDPATMSQDANQWVMPLGRLPRHPPQQVESDHSPTTPQN